VLEKQLQDIIRYTNELENREATMCAAASSPFLNPFIIVLLSSCPSASGYCMRTKRSRLKLPASKKPSEK
jgi:hypothetical protein